MQSSVSWRMVVLGGALLWGACSKEPAPAKAPPAAQPAQAPAPAEEPAAAPEAAAEAPSEPQAAAPAEEDAAPPEFKVGQSREEVMKRFGTCAERRAFIPPGPKTLYVEVYQAKNTEACKKRLGERQFTIRGGVLHKITPGLIPPPPPPSATAENM